VHGLVTRAKRDDYVADMLRRVGLDPSYRDRYPHQFSGGQRARIGIARALAVQPKFLVCDESVAALDVSIQAQVLNLFMQLRRDLNLTLLFISHDLGVVQHLRSRRHHVPGSCRRACADRGAVRVAEHPYTQALLANVPRLDARKQRFGTIKGEIPRRSTAARLPFSPALPARLRALQDRAAGTPGDRAGRTSACHLNDVT